MNATSSRWLKPKGRMTKRRRAQIENSRKRFSSSEVPSLPGGSRNQRFEPAIRDTKSSGFCTISREMWSDLLKNVLCSECGAINGLEIVEHQSYGFSTKVELICKRCDKSFGTSFTSERETETKSFSINNKIASAFLAIGRGHAALQTFSMVLGTQAMDRYVGALELQNEDVNDSSLNLGQKRDNRRVQQKKRKSTAAYKQTRNTKKYKKIATLKKVEKKEGKVYGAGIAN
ncbi:hypothetical protein JTE90_015821 [Oedothorax gibbosus]|uniref:Mutator-like transposase domain-containing protein n=1 Tax=Oedothorax gibbosus TaxID=931172 RepID=A0AAV6TKU7_9ARAC|nr:hypothetical protein JTE90_015821 [Oedothorax gibbosus]